MTSYSLPSGKLGGRTSTEIDSASATTADSSSTETPRRNAARVTARYITPVSKNRYPRCWATRCATVVFPEAAGPSMAMVRADFKACPGSRPSLARLGFAQGGDIRPHPEQPRIFDRRQATTPPPLQGPRWRGPGGFPGLGDGHRLA